MGIFEDEAWGSDAEAVDPETLHNVLGGRSAADAHPMGAITGLTAALDAIDGRLDDIEENPGGGGFDGAHNDLDGREIPDAHPSSAISMSPTTPSDWTTNPESVQDALDELAAREIATDPLVVEYLDSGDTMATDTTCAYIVTAGGPTLIGLPASHDTGRVVIINQSGETALLDHPGSSMVGIALLPTSSAALLHWIADGSAVGLSVGPAWLVHQLVPNPPGVEADGDVLTLDDQNGVAWRTPEAGGGSGTVDVVSNVATRRIVGRTTAGSGDSEELTVNQAGALLGIDSGVPGTLSGARAYTVPGRRISGVLTTLTISADKLYLVPITFARDWICTSLAFGVSAAVAGTTARIGMWAATDGLQGSGAPLMESGDISTASTGWKTYTPGSAVTGNAGDYLLGICATGAITLRGAMIPAADIDAAVLTSGVNSTGVLHIARRLTHTGGTALPSSPTWDTFSSNSSPTEIILAAQWSAQ